MARVVATDDARQVLASARSMLERDPVANNLVLTLLEEASTSAVAGTFWLVAEDDGDARAVALRWPASMPAVVSHVSLEFVDALVDAVAVAAPDLAAVGGDVATASAFAGSWVERCHQGAEPAEGQRIHRLVGSPRMPLVSGTLRPATSQDLDLVCRWSDGFALETGGFVAGHDAVRDRVRRREVWLWDDGGPVAMAAAKAPVASVSRVGPVYTPPESRGRGFAGAAVATLSAQLLSSVATTCILYTQLSNPTSNSVYRRIGYEPVIEVLRYRFIPRQPGEPRPRAGELRS